MLNVGQLIKGFAHAFLMIDHEIAGTVRLVGLLGLFISVSLWALAERLGHRKMLIYLSAGGALLSVLIYFVAVMTDADSGAHHFLPHFP